MRHGIDLKPIHNVKDARAIPSLLEPNCFGSDLVSVTGEAHRGVPGGAYRDRTDDLKLAKLALSQLS